MTDTKKTTKQKIVIVGGGFGGVKAALEICKLENAEVTLVSDREEFVYYPTLYHTATGGSDEQSVIPLKDIFDTEPVHLVSAKAASLDKGGKLLRLEKGSPIAYDKIIFSLGVVTNYFGIPGLAENAYGIKSPHDAEELKRHLHAHLIAEHEPDANYIIVGGGPTGIELAGNMASYMREIMRKHGIKRRQPHIDLVEAMPTLMPRMPKPVGRGIARRLRKLGIKLYLNSKVEGATADELTVSGNALRSHTIIWTAGVANNPFFVANAFPLSPRGKVLVDEFLRVDNEKDIFVLGDNAETPYSGMAQTALYDGEFVGHNFRFEAEGRPKLAYRAKTPIYVTPVGENWASVVWGKRTFNGRLGWMLRHAADLRAFSELLPIPEAAAQWSTELDSEHLCPVCSVQA